MSVNPKTRLDIFIIIIASLLLATAIVIRKGVKMSEQDHKRHTVTKQFAHDSELAEDQAAYHLYVIHSMQATDHWCICKTCTDLRQVIVLSCAFTKGGSQ